MNRIMVAFFAVVFLHVSSSLIYAQVPSEIKAGIVNSRATVLPKPEHPDEMKAAGITGMVKIAVFVDGEGNVISTEPIYEETKTIVLSDGTKRTEPAELPHPLLVSAALDAARGAKFEPTFLQGIPVHFRGVLVYRFGNEPDRNVSTPPPPPPPPSPSSFPDHVAGGVLNGKALSLPRPDYPASARAVGASGAVTIEILIDEFGSVIAARPVSGHPLLRAAATAAARNALFSPTTLSGNPVKVSGVLTYVFTLPDGSKQ